MSNENERWELRTKGKNLPDAEYELIQASVKAERDENGEVRCRECQRVLVEGEYTISLMGHGALCHKTECHDARKERLLLASRERRRLGFDD